jgi:hypothetical protein
VLFLKASTGATSRFQARNAVRLLPICRLAEQAKGVAVGGERYSGRDLHEGRGGRIKTRVREEGRRRVGNSPDWSRHHHKSVARERRSRRGSRPRESRGRRNASRDRLPGKDDRQDKQHSGKTAPLRSGRRRIRLGPAALKAAIRVGRRSDKRLGSVGNVQGARHLGLRLRLWRGRGHHIRIIAGRQAKSKSPLFPGSSHG